ncbi:lytic transglycosylase domain-containing protein [Nocardia cyriacigeorgica]|uniref:lytic transglycosylase domain-containing protein n=1 Tax=Nocardia cyriacigeorgica TaxID=135487 RepID=UPI001892FC6B|nr:lytic murein transglycosylase [Nocardia cyriacigeorgica]MBF6454584.1 lytic murein transglycosylase [Nocardia cyriacigeorgica]MBF6481261.1 lytic murein transglycosylase [Nocardia cyriacigeorgica]MBF6552478.1 lytic murein transglycosylase [Nocardia cyriacigeorgica]
MRMSAPVAVAAVIAAGVAAPSSAAGGERPVPAGEVPATVAESRPEDEAQARMVGLLPVSAPPPRMLRSVEPAGGVQAVQRYEVALPVAGGALGIPEVVLAAYRNAELAFASSAPGCGLSWHLLAGIGRIESGHAAGGRVDDAGTTVQPIFGPALDGTLPGNEVIPAAGGGYVRAIGPMQFLPGTWGKYAADGNGDGAADPHNIFDATVAAGRYLCSGGLDLRDPVQETRAVLRYNNSRAYATDVLSWSAAYRNGGAPARAVDVTPLPVPPPDSGDAPPAVQAAAVPGPLTLEPMTSVSVPHRPTPPLLTVPGLPPIDCGLLCAGGPEHTGPSAESPGSDPAPAAPPVEDAEPGLPGPSVSPEPRETPESLGTPQPPAAPEPLEAPEPPQVHRVPSITLPFGIVVPLPAPPT